MSDILKKIIEDKREEVKHQRAVVSLDQIMDEAEAASKALDFGVALLPLSDKPHRVIAECKKQSPSKGVMVEDYDPVKIALGYERGGAAAISVLTDKKYFGGHLDHLKVVREAVSLPIIRKDFIIDEYQVWQARASGADSFLLLAGVLDVAELQYFLEIGRDLGMEALVESHTEAELEVAMQTDAKILGINNRNLKNFDTNLENSKRLLKTIRKEGQHRIAVCESGIKDYNDIVTMSRVGYKSFLVGEALVTKDDHERAMRELILPIR